MMQISIGRDAAIALADTNWWVGKPAMEVAINQMATMELCMPFELFQQAVEEALGRPVWTHEFAYEGLWAELRMRKEQLEQEQTCLPRLN